MSELTLTLTDMAHGGLALGRERGGRPVFVPFAIPGETVRVRLPDDRRGFARGELLEVVQSSADRVTPRCRHFGICGHCHFQHMRYATQLRAKEAAARDQLTRVAGLKEPPLRPILPAPQEYGYRAETALYPAEEGGLGYWSPVERRIFRVEECPILQPALEAALSDVDVELPGLRRLTLRLGDGDELLAALEVDDVEPPELAAPGPGDRVLLSPGGAGHLTAALAGRMAEIAIVEPNPDAVADAAENLDEFDNVAIYEGTEEDIFPALPDEPDVLVLRPADGLSAAAFGLLERLRPRKRVIIIDEAGQLAKDAKRLVKMGYRPVAFQPVDVAPQGFQVEIVSLWRK